MSKTIKISGIGIHSGLPSNMKVRPTKRGGIIFVMNGKKIPATFDNVSATVLRNTTIGIAPDKVSTIEHTMSALFATGVKNAEITIDNIETPILDGAASELIKAIRSLEIKDQSDILVIEKEVVVHASEMGLPLWLRVMNFLRRRKRDGFVRLSPGNGIRLEMLARIIYPQKIIGDQTAKFVFDYKKFAASSKNFEKEIAPARTFGTLTEWNWLKKHGMGRGANTDNVIALGTIGDARNMGMDLSRAVAGVDGIAVLNGLKFPNEFARHKILDAAGDLYTSGYLIAGRFESYKGSHMLNNLLLRRLFSDNSNYRIIKHNAVIAV